METSVEKAELNFVEKFVKYFTKNSRLTILLIPILIIGGISAYQNLNREGFPPIQFPTVLITTPYFVNNAEQVNLEITEKIENILKSIEEVRNFQSTTNSNFSNIVVFLNENSNAKEIAQKIETQIKNEKFPNNVQPGVSTLKVTSRDNKSDLIFSIAKENKSIKDLQETAKIAAAKIQNLPEIKEAYVVEQIKERINPITGEKIESRESFGKFAIRENNNTKIYDSVSIGIVQEDTKNIDIIQLSNIVREKINKLQKEGEILEGYTISYNGDFAVNLQKQINSLENNALTAILIIVLISFFLINWRSSIILAIFFPLTLGAVFITMYALGLTINTITLFALILVLGLFVDDGIIIVEAVDRFKKQGYKNFTAVKKAIQAIGIADLLGTVTTVLVFVPLLFITGPLGRFIQQLPIMVIISLSISLIIGLSIVSFLSGIILSNKKENKKISIAEKILGISEKIVLLTGTKISKFVQWYLNSKLKTFLVILITFVFIGIGGYFASQLKFNIFPPSKDSNLISVSITFNNKTIEEAIETSKKIDEILINEIGQNLNDYEYVRATERSATIFINLVPFTERSITSVEIGDRIKNKLQNIEDIDVLVTTSVTGGPADPRPFKMQIYSEDTNLLETLSNKIKKYIEEVTLKNSEIKTVEVTNLNLIAKREGKRYAQIEVGFDGNQTSATLLELEKILKENILKTLQEEYAEIINNETFGFDSGFATANAESFASLQGAFTLSLVVMYLLLMIQFNSYTQPLLILLAIPFSFPLLFPGLYLTKNDLSFFVTLGLTSLIGIVVNNSIVLIEYTNQARSQGMSIKESISSAIEQRFRPILTTTITSVVGLIPLAITDPFWEPLALTIVFGLTSSTIFVLFAYPAFFAIIEKFRTIKNKFIPKTILG